MQHIFVNLSPLTDELLHLLQKQLDPVAAGSYWYDTACGAWGKWGRAIETFLMPGLPISKPLQAEASNGQSGFFLNGRQLPLAEVVYWQMQFPGPLPIGSYWLDDEGCFGFTDGPQLGKLHQELLYKIPFPAHMKPGKRNHNWPL